MNVHLYLCRCGGNSDQDATKQILLGTDSCGLKYSFSPQRSFTAVQYVLPAILHKENLIENNVLSSFTLGKCPLKIHTEIHRVIRVYMF